MFLTAFIVALSVQWKLALIAMTIIPLIIVVTFIVLTLDTRIEARIIRIFSRAAVLAEEAFSSIRTVHAFWAQTKMSKKYDVLLQQAHTEGRKKGPLYGLIFATQYFSVYAGIAVAFWEGYRLYASGEVSNVGQVFTYVGPF